MGVGSWYAAGFSSTRSKKSSNQFVKKKSIILSTFAMLSVNSVKNLTFCVKMYRKSLSLSRFLVLQFFDLERYGVPRVVGVIELSLNLLVFLRDFSGFIPILVEFGFPHQRLDFVFTGFHCLHLLFDPAELLLRGFQLLRDFAALFCFHALPFLSGGRLAVR